MITWLKRDWVWQPPFQPNWWQRGWPWSSDWSPWVRRLHFGLWGYGALQWLRGGGPRSPSILGLTAFWLAFHATVLLLASIWLELRDDPRLDWPSDPAA
jgi:hypothetical protein